MKGLKNSLKKLSLRRSNSKVSQLSTEWESLIDKSEQRIAYLEAFPKVLVYKDYVLPGDVIHSKVLDDLQDFEVRESDIFIISYPQSGSSVVEEIIVQIVQKLHEKSESRRARTAQVARLEVANPYGHIRWLTGLKSPRILTTNLPFNLIPENVKNNTICKVSDH